ncbi:MAG: flagellar basal-body MS-ring/collar protein FliF [Azonexus sp.]|jgi:flagellar M-ring protein FliF|nr:flagellar basal-body MS-ring/collar protein FliF [Azonexus sp.]
MVATTENPAGISPPDNPIGRLREAFDRLTMQQKIGFAVALAAIFSLLVGAYLWSQQPDYRILFSNLNEKDGGSIVAALEQQNIPHKLSSSGAIMVPADRVHDVRLKLAAQGLPRGGMVGFELMENQKFGISQFAEQVNYQRGLEGELARTIMSIGAVQSARVHLAIPKPSVFVRESQKPTASVLLSLYPGRSLDGGQIAGITHLISSSVPQLQAGNVSILDQNGSLLSTLKNSLTEAGLDATQLKYVREIEQTIVSRIEDILKPVLGEENFKVQVAADIDFSQTEQTAETFRPNATPDASTMRSQQSQETASVSTVTGGVPGALTNQPPVPATAPLTTPAVGGTANAGNANVPGRIDAAGVTAPINAAGQPINTTKNSTINYEVDRTIRHTRQGMGAVRRLTAAVVVNHRKEIDAKSGKELVKPLAETEMKQINDLVREAMGFSQDRGDSISVANAPFTLVEKTEVEIPLWKDPENQALAREALKYLLIAGLIAFLYFKIVQPTLKTMFPPPPEPAENGGEDAEGVAGSLGNVAVIGEDGQPIEDQVTIDHYAVKVQKARDIAQADPKAVANLIKEWMGANAG